MNKRFDELYEQLLKEHVYDIDSNGKHVLYTAPESNNSLYIMRILQSIENNAHLVKEINDLSQKKTNTSTFRQDLKSFFEKVKKEDKTGRMAAVPQPVWDSLTNYAFSRIAGDAIEDATLPAWEGAPSSMRIVDAFDKLMSNRTSSGVDPEDKNQQIIPFSAYVSNYTGEGGGVGLNNLFKPDQFE